MSSFTFRHTGRHFLSIGLLSLLSLLAVFVNMPMAHAATAKVHRPATPYYLEDFRETGRAGTFDFKVHQYPYYHYDGFNTSIGWIDIYDNGVYRGTMKGTLDQYSAGGAQFSGLDLTTTGSMFYPNVFHDTVKWFPPHPTLYADRGCYLTPNPLESAFGDVIDDEKCPGNHPLNETLVGYDATLHRVVRRPWYSTDGQGFIWGVIHEANGFNTMTSALEHARPAFQYPTNAATPISPSVLTNSAFIAANRVTREAFLHPLITTFAVGLGLLAIGAVMVLGGTILNQWCAGNSNSQCLGQHTTVWVRLGGVIAALGGLALTAGGLLAGPGIGAMITGQGAATTALGGVELATGTAVASPTASEIAAAENLAALAFAERL